MSPSETVEILVERFKAIITRTVGGERQIVKMREFLASGEDGLAVEDLWAAMPQWAKREILVWLRRP